MNLAFWMSWAPPGSSASVSGEDILSFLFVLATGGAWAGLFTLVGIHVWKGRRTREAIARGEGLNQAALLLNGDIAGHGSSAPPFVRFATEGTACRLHKWMLFEGRPDVVTTFEGRIGFRGFLEATSRRASRYPTRSSRFRSLPETAGFQIVTTDMPWASEMLDGGLRDLLGALTVWGRRARVALAADRFLVEVESNLRPDAAVTLARAILPRLIRLGRAENLSTGVSFVGETTLTNQGRCPVCSQSCTAPDPPCPTCQVLQHPDCWVYWGRCGIFGCRGALATSAARR